MPFQAVPQGIQVRLLMEQNGVKMENVWNVDYGAPVTPIGLALVNGIFDAWITAVNRYRHFRSKWRSGHYGSYHSERGRGRNSGGR